jgi:hypothetical protein
MKAKKLNIIQKIVRLFRYLEIRHSRFISDPKNAEFLLHEIQQLHKIGFICALILIASCTGIKTTVKSKENLNQKVTTEVSKDVQAKQDVQVNSNQSSKKDSASAISIEQIERRTGEWEFMRTIYDTALPVDKSTGTAPVKEKITYKSKQKSEQDYKSLTDVTFTLDEVSNIKARIKSEYDAKIDSLQKENTQLNKNIASKETPANKSWWIWFIAGVLTPLVIRLLIWLLTKTYLKK